MKQPQSFTTRLSVLALLLAFGPLQATATFACEMMETVVEETCCCDEAPATRDNDDGDDECGDDMSSMATVPCCELGANVGIDAEAFKASSAPKSGNKVATTPFDVDPPDAGIVDTLAGPGSPPPVQSASAHSVTFDRRSDDSTLWLTTRRLRI